MQHIVLLPFGFTCRLESETPQWKSQGETPSDLLGASITGETVVADQMSVILRGGFGDPGPVGLTEVDVEKASSQTVAVAPFKPVHQ